MLPIVNAPLTYDAETALYAGASFADVLAMAAKSAEQSWTFAASVEAESIAHSATMPADREASIETAAPSAA